MRSHTKKWKEAQVQELQELADKYPVIAIASIKSFPGALAKELRKKLKGKAVIKVSKTRIIEKALKASKKETKEVMPHVTGSIAIIFTEMNPFELYAFLKKNKASMPAKAGMTAPNDITVPAGDTGLPPGPALSDLKAAGLKTIIQGPTISIAEDKIVAKKGEEITAQITSALTKLGIKPVKIGLNVTACLEKGQLFLAKTLDIDPEKTRQQFAQASKTAFNLAMQIGYYTKETVTAMIPKAFKQAKAVAIEANILTKETTEEILAKANSQAQALKQKIPEQPKTEEKQKETKEPEKQEEKQEEKNKEKKQEEKQEEK